MKSFANFFLLSSIALSCTCNLLANNLSGNKSTDQILQTVENNEKDNAVLFQVIPTDDCQTNCSTSVQADCDPKLQMDPNETSAAEETVSNVLSGKGRASSSKVSTSATTTSQTILDTTAATHSPIWSSSSSAAVSGKTEEELLEKTGVSKFLENEICNNIYLSCLARVGEISRNRSVHVGDNYAEIEQEAKEWAAAEEKAIRDVEKRKKELEKATQAKETVGKTLNSFNIYDFYVTGLAEKFAETKVTTAEATLFAIKVKNTAQSAGAATDVKEAIEEEKNAYEALEAAKDITVTKKLDYAKESYQQADKNYVRRRMSLSKIWENAGNVIKKQAFLPITEIEQERKNEAMLEQDSQIAIARESFAEARKTWLPISKAIATYLKNPNAKPSTVYDAGALAAGAILGNLKGPDDTVETAKVRDRSAITRALVCDRGNVSCCALAGLCTSIFGCVGGLTLFEVTGVICCPIACLIPPCIATCTTVPVTGDICRMYTQSIDRTIKPPQNGAAIEREDIADMSSSNISSMGCTTCTAPLVAINGAAYAPLLGAYDDARAASKKNVLLTPCAAIGGCIYGCITAPCAGVQAAGDFIGNTKTNTHSATEAALAVWRAYDNTFFNGLGVVPSGANAIVVTDAAAQAAIAAAQAVGTGWEEETNWAAQTAREIAEFNQVVATRKNPAGRK